MSTGRVDLRIGSGPDVLKFTEGYVGSKIAKKSWFLSPEKFIRL